MIFILLVFFTFFKKGIEYFVVKSSDLQTSQLPLGEKTFPTMLDFTFITSINVSVSNKDAVLGTTKLYLAKDTTQEVETMFCCMHPLSENSSYIDFYVPENEPRTVFTCNQNYTGNGDIAYTLNVEDPAYVEIVKLFLEPVIPNLYATAKIFAWCFDFYCRGTVDRASHLWSFTYKVDNAASLKAITDLMRK